MNQLSTTPLKRLGMLDGYRESFMDPVLWEPYVIEVCQRHNLARSPALRAGLPGSFPTFIADNRWVVKFFGELFEGLQSFIVEREVNDLIGQDRALLAPAVLASGQLFEAAGSDWYWPYLIFDYIDGITIGEVYSSTSFEDKLSLARQIGHMTHRLHRLGLTGSSVLHPNWDNYLTLLKNQIADCQQRHRNWKTMPDHLIEQIPSFLLSLHDLVNVNTTPHLIHADITADHILGRFIQRHWHTLGLIDFGDAMVGDIVYELIALHLDLFHCDKRMLIAFLDSYGLDEQFRYTLPKRAMCLTLLHRFDTPATIFSHYPQIRDVPTLDELANLVWNLNKPGLGQ